MNIAPQKANICCVIVTYYPDNNFFKRLSLISSQVGGIVVVNNGSREDFKSALEKQKNEGKVNVIFNERNLGVATALNQGCRFAQSQGYDWALTLDQDTVCKKFMVDTLVNIFHGIEDSHRIAVIGSNYFDDGTSQVVGNRHGRIKRPWVEKKTVITSGSLLSLRIFQKIGPFRDDFFIDAVDHEYCLRARRMGGYKIIFVLRPFMRHAVGEKTHYIHLWGLKILISSHASFRRYFMTRNGLILIREYFFQDTAWAILRFCRLINSVALMCLIEDQKIKKLKFVILAIKDFAQGNTKRTIDDHICH